MKAPPYVLTLADGHELPIVRDYLAAHELHQEDFVFEATGSSIRVESVQMITVHGLFNPNTLNGHGIITSTYTDDIHTLFKIYL